MKYAKILLFIMGTQVREICANTNYGHNSIRQQKDKILSQIYIGYYAASPNHPAFNPFPCDSVW